MFLLRARAYGQMGEEVHYTVDMRVFCRRYPKSADPGIRRSRTSGSRVDTPGLDVLLKSQRCYKTHMPATRAQTLLTKRERQIMDVLYRLGRATAAEIMDGVPGAPGYSTVRTQLRVLERKGHVKHEEQGLRYVYMPTLPRHSARKSALKHLVDTFFDGSSAKAVAALLGGEAARVSDEELERIAELVTNARMAELVKNVRSESR